MKSAETLHNAAMEFYELGKIAKVKGRKEVHEEYLEKAYVIAIEAGLRCQIEFEETDPLKAVYLRSISWLAFDAKKYEEAYHWANIALNIVPNSYEEVSLEKLLLKINAKIQRTELMTSLQGIITSFDLEQHNIHLRQNQKEHITIGLVNSYYYNIIPFYIGKSVEVEVDNNDKNQLVLKRLRLAA